MTTELAVGGMTCASCVSHVTRALKNVPGVETVTVNLATEQATISHDAAVAAAQLIAAVEKAGYRAVPDTGDADDDALREREFIRRRRLLVLALALFIPTLVLGMFVGDFPYKDLVMFALTLPVWAIVGWSFHRGALAALRHGNATMDTLVSLGSTAAFSYSVWASLTGAPSYYETASAIVTLVYAGKFLESLAKGRTNRAMRALLDLRPERARRLTANGDVVEIAADELLVGDRVQLVPGDRLPVDGVVVSGESTLDVSALTGEPIPREVAPGDAVSAGSINGDGTLVVRATAVGAGTTLARIVEIVKHAQGTTPPVQRLADRVAGVFVPAIVAIAILTVAGWLLTGHPWPLALAAGIAVLVVACPCALGLATPAAVIAGVGAAAARGILVRDADAFERLAHVRAVLFDKTGTLTRGRPEVTAIVPSDGASESDVLAVAASLERHASHPLAQAVMRAAERAHVDALAVLGVTTVRGGGIRGVAGDARLAAGTARFLRDLGVDAHEPDAATTTMLVARDTRVLGTIAFEDEPRPHARDAIRELRALGVTTGIVSGDAEGPVTRLAAALDVEETFARVTPDGKAERVRATRERSGAVAFVGDGINDAPALALADVGIAMGGGTAVALETAAVALLTDDPRGVARSVALARATLATIHQNLFWAFAYNVVLVPLAAFGVVRPIFAAAAMGVSSLFVVGNALRLYAARR